MKVVIVNKSDSRGGAAVVSHRLMMALRRIGVDARMLVAEKLTDSPYVALAAAPWRLKAAFYADRLPIAMANGFKRSTLFQLDAASAGVDISNHPWVKDADALLLNWINQGLLSLSGIEKLLRSGKRVIWTMHDMWNLTGLCHHAGACRRWAPKGYSEEYSDLADGDCGDCPLLGKHASPSDLSYRVHEEKRRLYNGLTSGGCSSEEARPERISFVAVSSWLGNMAAESTLLGNQDVCVIPNAFPTEGLRPNPAPFDPTEKITILFGAARLDDPIKDFPTLIAAMRCISKRTPDFAARMKLQLFGSIRDASLIDKIKLAASPITVEYLGMISSQDEIRRLYEKSQVVVSTSRYETLPGTLIEGQAYGAMPVSFDRGGQRDIITHLKTGYLAEWDAKMDVRAERMAEGVIWCAETMLIESPRLRCEMLLSVEERFSEESVARRYLNLIKRR